MINLTILEWTANFFYLISVILAARNNVHTWWTGIVGTVLFTILFYLVQLYADVTLMIFYLGTSLYGWLYWARGKVVAPIKKTQLSSLALFTICALMTMAGYGALLFFLTDAYAPFIDSAVLTFSVLAQLLLMTRRLETWVFWIVVDTLAVPLYFSRELYLTSFLYLGFWFNAWYGLYLWHNELKEQRNKKATA